MKRIWKAQLAALDVQEIETPKGAEFLCAREQGNEICVWFLCEPNAPREKRMIAVVGTGHPAPDDGSYLGTASLDGGSLIFHVFEVLSI